MSKINLVICDDHILFSSALSEMLQRQDEFEILFTANNGADLLDRLKNRPILPEVILLDINMPIMDGFETSKMLTANYPSIKILALSMNRSNEDVIKMLRNGARGYVLKDATGEELVEAIHDLHNKGFYINEISSKNTVDLLQNRNTILINDREKEFLKFICTELTYKEIADRMNVSHRTIDGYRDSLFQKLNVKTRTGLAVYAIQHKYFILD